MTEQGPQRPELERLRIARRDDDAHPVRSRHLITGVVMLLVVGLGVWRLLPADGAKSEHASTPALGAAGPAAVTARRAGLSATGYVVAQRKAAVSSKATGRLAELNVVEGDRVQAGQVLAVLEHQDLSAAVRALESELNSARARVRFAEAELSEARINLERVVKLIPRNAVAASALDQAQAREKKAAADLEISRAAVGAAQANLDRALVELDYTRIRAPFDGTVLTKNADVGEIVAPLGSSANARAAVVTLADMTSLQVEADVSEANLARVTVGQRCLITLDSYPDKQYQGAVANIVPTVDRAKGTVLVKIRFLALDNTVIPEMSAKVEFVPQQEKGDGAD